MATLTLKKPSTRVSVKSEPTLNDRVDAYRDYLMQTYPTLFNSDSPKPLAIGIHQGLLKTRPDGVSKRTVRVFLSRWTRKAPYRQALAAGGHRFALSGMPDGRISPEHQEAVAPARQSGRVAVSLPRPLHNPYTAT